MKCHHYCLLFVTFAFMACNKTPDVQVTDESSFATRAAGADDYYYGSEGKIPIVKSSEKSYVLLSRSLRSLARMMR